jgi:hypothetical protein
MDIFETLKMVKEGKKENKKKKKNRPMTIPLCEPVTKQHTGVCWIKQNSQEGGHSWTTTKPTLTTEQQAFLISISDWLNHTAPRHRYTWFGHTCFETRLWMGQYLGQTARNWLMREEFGNKHDQKAYDEMMQDMREFMTKN